jgi:hypothetical protein
MFWGVGMLVLLMLIRHTFERGHNRVWDLFLNRASRDGIELFHRVLKKRESKKSSKKDTKPCAQVAFACECILPSNAVVFAFCRVHVVHVVRFVTRVGQDVDVGQSVCVAKSLEDV